MWCEENNLTALKRRSFSDALVAACGKYNLEHCNTITNLAGRRVWGFMGIEAVARPHINEFTDASQCTYAVSYTHLCFRISTSSFTMIDGCF